jgi:uncharacterized surface protein with fasciclin (FAS1) repeats
VSHQNDRKKLDSLLPSQLPLSVNMSATMSMRLSSVRPAVVAAPRRRCAPAARSAVVTRAASDIIDTAKAAGFNTLVAAVQAAGLTETLKGGSFTVFAPTDAACACPSAPRAPASLPACVQGFSLWLR